MNARRLSTILFWALTLGQIVPLWAFEFIPTHDGPAHVGNARIIERCVNGCTTT